MQATKEKPAAAAEEVIAVPRMPTACSAAIILAHAGEQEWTSGYRFKAPASGDDAASDTLGLFACRTDAAVAALQSLENALAAEAETNGDSAEGDRLRKMQSRVAAARKEADDRQASKSGIKPAAVAPAAAPAPDDAAKPAARQTDLLPAPPPIKKMASADGPLIDAKGKWIGPFPDFAIDPEFQSLCPEPSIEERSLLESQICRDGCREPLVIWQSPGGIVLIDGHTRLAICRGLGIPFDLRVIELADRGAAINWIIANQLGRRNLSEEQKSYLRGKRYQAEKKEQGGDRKSNAQNEHLIPTHEKLAKEYNVAPNTIRRDADFAAGVDAVAAEEGERSKAEILAGRSKRTKAEVTAKAKPPKEKAEKPKRDRNVNSAGVFTKGIETVEVPVAGRCRAEIDVVQGQAGSWYCGERFSMPSGSLLGQSSAPTIHGKKFASRGEAIRAAVASLIDFAEQAGKVADSARVGQLAEGIVKSAKKFLAQLPDGESDDDKIGLPHSVAEAGLSLVAMKRLHEVINRIADLLVEKAIELAGPKANAQTIGQALRELEPGLADRVLAPVGAGKKGAK